MIWVNATIGTEDHSITVSDVVGVKANIVGCAINTIDTDIDGDIAITIDVPSGHPDDAENLKAWAILRDGDTVPIEIAHHGPEGDGWGYHEDPNDRGFDH